MTLELCGLTKTHPGGTLATISNLDLTVEGGRITALLGPSGAGKTTVMKLIAGLLTPDAGQITLAGRSILPLPPEQRGVVMVFQNPLLFPHLTVAGNVGFGLRMRGLPTAEIQARVADMLERTQLTGLGSRRPAELSGGQAQRVALARALVLKPDLLLLDEPLSSLDPTLRDDMRALILTLQRETAVTTLVVTHDQTEAVVLADRIALLLEGRLAQHGPPDQVYRQPASLAVARFFGGVNFLPGRAAEGVFQSTIGPIALPADLPPALADGPGVLTIRPEAVDLVPPAQRGALTARVLAATFLGTQSRVELDLGGPPLQALVSPDFARGLTQGQMLGVILPPAALWVVPGPA
ncbi:MAG: ABC transporter ATP-binding protein [Rhodobacterales bacterium]|nr:MAG: ABC transporter ATP-binding protein [Rhodobacterales bacterium]